MIQSHPEAHRFYLRGLRRDAEAQKDMLICPITKVGVLGMFVVIGLPTNQLPRITVSVFVISSYPNLSEKDMLILKRGLGIYTAIGMSHVDL